MDYEDRVTGVYCDLSKNEDPDNKRFLSEVSLWVGKPLTVIKSDKFSTVEEVFEKRKYMSGVKGAPCTVEMKKVPRFNFQMADDINIFGFTAGEEARADKFSDANPDMRLEWNLIDKEYSRDFCGRLIQSVGIRQPIRYEQGFLNNNCECCVKATSINYWVLSRRVNPETFKRRAEQSRRIGARLCRYNGERIYLDEIPPDDQILFYGKPLKISKSTESISCGPECAGL